MNFKNLLNSIPSEPEEEIFQDIVKSDNIRIERIVSHGHKSSENKWYDQSLNEWVMVISGSAIIGYEDGSKTELGPNDFLNIPAHTKHQVLWTTPNENTIWLAIHY